MAYVKEKTVLPVYLVGITWLVWSLVGPLYRPTHYIMCALVSAIVYYVGKMLFPDKGYDAAPGAQQQQQQQQKQAAPQAAAAASASAASAASASRAGTAKAEPKKEYPPEIQELLKERDRAVSEMKRLNDAILDPGISAKIDRMQATTDKIIQAVVEKPAKLPQIRKFLNYYLPTTLKLLNAYDRMDSTGAAGENISGTKEKITSMLDTICVAFDKQLDALYGEEAMDISTDIEVMQNLLAQEGLGGMQIGTP